MSPDLEEVVDRIVNHATDGQARHLNITVEQRFHAKEFMEGEMPLIY
jgi:hypothetical protein